MDKDSLMSPKEDRNSFIGIGGTSFIAGSQSHIWDDVPNPCKRVAKAIYFSSKCRYIYIFLLIYNCVLGVWAAIYLLKNKPLHWSFYVFESGINLVLSVDVTFRLWIKGCHNYWKERTNVFEFVMVWTCVLITVLSVVELAPFTGKYDEIVDLVIMASLCMLQYVRIIFFITKQHHTGVHLLKIL